MDIKTDSKRNLALERVKERIRWRLRLKLLRAILFVVILVGLFISWDKPSEWTRIVVFASAIAYWSLGIISSKDKWERYLYKIGVGVSLLLMTFEVFTFLLSLWRSSM